MLRRRAFAEIHFRYALDLRRAAPVCKDRLLRAYRLPDAACDLGEARGKGGHYGRRIVCRAVLFRLGTDGPACEKKNSDCAAVIHKEKPRRGFGVLRKERDQINISAGERTSRAAFPHARGQTRCVCGARGSARGCAYAAPCTCGSPQPPRTGTGRRRPDSCP